MQGWIFFEVGGKIMKIHKQRIASLIIAGCVAAQQAAAQQVGMARFNEKTGALSSLKNADGVEFSVLGTQRSPLFVLLFHDAHGEKIYLRDGDATSVVATATQAGVTFCYRGFARINTEVLCSAHAETNGFVRWRIHVKVSDGTTLRSVQYPCFNLAAPLGSSVDDDALVWGASKGGIQRRPGAQKEGARASISQPGNMAAQFGCYYDDRAGFYTAAYDAKGYPKDLIQVRTKTGVELSWYRACVEQKQYVQDYDVVTGFFSAQGGQPTDWRDGADLYKAWAVQQTWSRTLFKDRGDLPSWMRDAPVMVRFGRDWIGNPERIEQWMTSYWKKEFPQMPLLVALWGWEKVDTWITPNYFPVYPDEAQFSKMGRSVRAQGGHLFPWPSGYHWTLTYQKRDDGTFAYEDRAAFDAKGKPLAIVNEDGQMYLRKPSWLHGGECACLCGGEEGTRRWWNEDICLPLAKLGCELIQVDQVVGGNFPSCFAENHAHPKGRGLWMTESFSQQLVTMRQTMLRAQKDVVVCVEEPNEWFNHQVGIQDYRDCETGHEWASVFNYLYHEYLPCFQSNPHSEDRVMDAHCFADGQMPHFIPLMRDISDEVIVNGGLESMRGWDHLKGYNNQVWNGRASIVSNDVHGGQACLRIENAVTNDIVQVSQNVVIDGRGLRVGGAYRLNAWMKVDHAEKQNGINFGLFAPEMKSLGHGGTLRFPQTQRGWQRISADFTVPEGAVTLRIMIHASGKVVACVDDVTIEEKKADGSYAIVQAKGVSSTGRFMRRWVDLYHNEGRAWLCYGKMIHPPVLKCATMSYRNRQVPTIWHNAFVAQDGRKAVILVNGTRDAQQAELVQANNESMFIVPADDAVLIVDGVLK